MRKITREAVEAFICGDDFKKTNTIVCRDNTGAVLMFLYGSVIAKRDSEGLSLNHRGYTTVTTKERLNGILEELGLGYIYQKNFEWFFDDGTPVEEGWNFITSKYKAR